MNATSTSTYQVMLAAGADVPMSAEMIVRAYQAGTLRRDTLLWREGWLEWFRLEDAAREIGVMLQPAAVTAPVPHMGTVEPVQRTMPSRRSVVPAEAQPVAKPARKGWQKAVLRIVCAVVLLFGLFLAFGIYVYSTDNYGILREAKDAVRANLRAPSTAEFEVVNQWKDATGATVLLDVDAQNGFGAKLRSRWVVRFGKTERGNYYVETAAPMSAGVK